MLTGDPRAGGSRCQVRPRRFAGIPADSPRRSVCHAHPAWARRAGPPSESDGPVRSTPEIIREFTPFIQVQMVSICSSCLLIAGAGYIRHLLFEPEWLTELGSSAVPSCDDPPTNLKVMVGSGGKAGKRRIHGDAWRKRERATQRHSRVQGGGNGKVRWQRARATRRLRRPGAGSAKTGSPARKQRARDIRRPSRGRGGGAAFLDDGEGLTIKHMKQTYPLYQGYVTQISKLVVSSMEVSKRKDFSFPFRGLQLGLWPFQAILLGCLEASSALRTGLGPRILKMADFGEKSSLYKQPLHLKSCLSNFDFRT